MLLSNLFLLAVDITIYNACKGEPLALKVPSHPNDWANARFNPEALSTNHYSSVRQQYFIRTMYELGIWSESDVEGFGAVKK